MQKQDGQIAHRTSYQDRDTGEECSRILEFAMHRAHDLLRHDERSGLGAARGRVSASLSGEGIRGLGVQGTRMTDHRSLHEALKVEEVRRHGATGLEYVVVKLQKSKTDIKYTLHARPTFYTLSGGITQADLLHHLGFSNGPCAFLTGDQCIARQVPEDFDVPAFAKTVESAFAELQTGIKLLFECGFTSSTACSANDCHRLSKRCS
jgi:hypothetical protein